MRLIVSYFIPSNSQREREINHCLLQNLNNSKITEMIVLDETGYLQSKGKMKVIHHSRPTYGELIRLFGDGVNIIANSDIWFNETIEKAEALQDGKNCYAITRTEIIGGELVKFENAHYNCPPHFSQDVWIFRGKHDFDCFDKVEAWHSTKRITEVIPFQMGIGGCDNIFAWNLLMKGYDVRNPYNDIICIHEHEDRGRPVYTHRITGGRGIWGKVQQGRVTNTKL